MPNCYFSSVAILDDDATFQYLTKRILVDNAIAEKVQVYSNGLILLNDLARNLHNLDLLPELLFLDIEMPAINGFEILDQLALLPNAIVNKVRVVLLSSNLRSAAIDKLIEKGVILDFFNKPLTKSDLHVILSIVAKESNK